MNSDLVKSHQKSSGGHPGDGKRRREEIDRLLSSELMASSSSAPSFLPTGTVGADAPGLPTVP